VARFLNVGVTFGIRQRRGIDIYRRFGSCCSWHIQGQWIWVLSRRRVPYAAQRVCEYYSYNKY